MTIHATLRYWSKGIRLYIALASLLITASVIWWAHTAYAGTTLFPSRVEETFAWLALGLMTLAISIGPIVKRFDAIKGKQLLFDARRMIGISAAWFAALHVGIAYASQFHFANPFSLPAEYQRSFVFGAIALLVLLAMTATSFDAAFKCMGIWWFRLHRFVYVAVVAALLHAVLIGVHAAQSSVLMLLVAIAAMFALLYASLWYRGDVTSKWQRVGVIAMTIAVAAIIIFGFSRHVPSLSQTTMYGAGS